MPNEKEILALLPHQPPFRFVDNVIRYEPGRFLQAKFSPPSLEVPFGISKEIPETILIEGLAQVAVLLTQLETEPLKEGDIPLLGSVNVTLIKKVQWGETLIYTVEPIRILEKQAVLKGRITVGKELTVVATLSVAVANDQL
jgi:3-hydroxymyristoyl/3-hydroxydecanoyl-(acyl carrier protein) dehydratase